MKCIHGTTHTQTWVGASGALGEICKGVIDKVGQEAKESIITTK